MSMNRTLTKLYTNLVEISDFLHLGGANLFKDKLGHSVSAVDCGNGGEK
jgi:hypothetical protein